MEKYEPFLNMLDGLLHHQLEKTSELIYTIALC